VNVGPEDPFHPLWSVCVAPQAHEHFEEPKLEAVRDNNMELVQDILKDLSPLADSSTAADELARILQEPHFQVRGLPPHPASQSYPRGDGLALVPARL
jgi:hypothetical protein